MKNIFIDTNVLLRLLLNDNKDQFIIARKIFEQAQDKKIKITCLNIVVAEVVFVLKKVYGKTNEEIGHKLGAFIKVAPAEFEDNDAWLWVLEKYVKSSLGIVDLFVIKKSEMQTGEVFSFDKKLMNYQRRIK